ncbi:MAG TPA: GtrA family protein [Terriglobia bacterium]|nr:GtrA family protein [Terriglobia bacterium]
MKRPWMRFYTVGLGGVGVQTLVLAILKSGFGLHYLAATIIAVETAVLHNFYWHERWTWAHRNLEWSGAPLRLVRFNAGNGLISLAGNVSLMWLLVSKLHIHYLVATCIGIGTCSLVNYLVSDRLIFRRRVPLETAADETAPSMDSADVEQPSPGITATPGDTRSRRRGHSA